jgi:hypothetical protein
MTIQFSNHSRKLDRSCGAENHLTSRSFRTSILYIIYVALSQVVKREKSLGPAAFAGLSTTQREVYASSSWDGGGALHRRSSSSTVLCGARRDLALESVDLRPKSAQRPEETPPPSHFNEEPPLLKRRTPKMQTFIHSRYVSEYVVSPLTAIKCHSYTEK